MGTVIITCWSEPPPLVNLKVRPKNDFCLMLRWIEFCSFMHSMFAFWFRDSLSCVV